MTNLPGVITFDALEDDFAHAAAHPGMGHAGVQPPWKRGGSPENLPVHYN